jgi:hypothetical protein
MRELRWIFEDKQETSIVVNRLASVYRSIPTLNES